MKKSILLLVSDYYPLHPQESFIEDEITHLSAHYHKIYVLTPKEGAKRKKTYESGILPENVVFIEFGLIDSLKLKLYVLRYLLKRSFWRELAQIRSTFKLRVSLKLLKQLFSFLRSADSFYVITRKFLKRSGFLKHQVTIYTFHTNAYTLGSVFLRRRLKLNGVFTRVQEVDAYPEWSSNQYLPMLSLMFKYADAVFPVTAHLKNYIQDHYKVADIEKVFIAYASVAAQTPNYELSSFNPGKLRIVSISYLNKTKNLDTLIIALERINHIQIEWTHIGEYDDQEGIKQDAFNRLFNKSNIHYTITGGLPRREVLHLLQSKPFDVFINLGIGSGIPVALIEAFSAGIPAISTFNDGLEEIIEDRKNGYLIYKELNEDKVIAAIDFFSSLTNEEYGSFRKNAKEMHALNFSAEKNSNELAYNFNQLMRHAKRS